MDEALFLDSYGVRDGTTRFMRSIESEPGIMAFIESQARKTSFSICIAECSTGESLYSYALLTELQQHL